MKLLLLLYLSCLILPSMELEDDEIEIFRQKAMHTRCGSEGVNITVNSDNLRLISNGLPDHIWGCVNPNYPKAITVDMTIPKNPEVDKDGPFCLSMGSVAMAINGVAIFNPFAGGFTNAVEGASQEEFDCCGGHSEIDGTYHYHKLPLDQGGCDNPILKSTDIEKPQLIGVAYDGFPIYSQWNDLDLQSLDECHGMILPEINRYAYVAVYEHFPYILGCFKGKPVKGSENTQCTNLKRDEVCSCEVGAKTTDDVTDYDVSKIMADITKVDDVLRLYNSYTEKDKPQINELLRLMRRKRALDQCGHTECRDITLKRKPWFNHEDGYCQCGGTDTECGCPVERGCPPTGDSMNGDSDQNGGSPLNDGRGPPNDGRGPPPDGRGSHPDGRAPPPDGRGPPPDGRGPPPDGRGPPPDGRGPL